MRETDIIDNLRVKLTLPVGRHLYGVLGSYESLNRFEIKLRQAKTPTGKRFPKSLNVNKGILDSIPDDDFRKLVSSEAKLPEPTAAHVAKAFESFLRTILQKKGLIVLSNLEMLFAYSIELNLLRTLAADDYRILLFLPGTRTGGTVIMFNEMRESNYRLPTNLIADNHLWEIDRKLF